MKVSLNWLKDYISIDFDTKELSEKLTMAGIEVEAIEDFSIPKGVVVAEIRERKVHPNADKLSICRVWDGKEEYSVVCGAPNCDAGKRVPFAKPGAIFTDPKTGQSITISKREIRKVASDGMLCSGKELGLEQKSDGLLELPLDIEIGISLSEIYPSDTVFDLEITPNRPDLLSHIGIARDIAAIYSLDVNLPSAAIFAKAPEISTANIVSVLAPELCPRYTARIVRGVKVAESPIWLKDRLRKIGLRPINNIVDITNYVLFETGQPLHAFDLSMLEGEKIIVRRSFKGEKIKVLDGSEHELEQDILVICDERKPVALAGIMGGENSGVTEETTDILIESAYFEPSNIRASSKKLGISSDSSHRFERGVDIELLSFASDRALSLIMQIAGGELGSELIDMRAKNRNEISIKCRYEKIRSLLGIEISNDEIKNIFIRLNCSLKEESEDICIVCPPSYRLDLFNEADLAEEVLRIGGISQIPIRPPEAICGGLIEHDAYLKEENFKNSLVGLGLTECLNYSFFDKKSALLDPRFDEKSIVPIANPLSKDSEFMRPSLFCGILQTVDRNISNNSSDLAIFETGKVFYRMPSGITETSELIIALTGRKHPEMYSQEKNQVYDFYDMKGLVKSIMLINRSSDWSFVKLPEGFRASKIFTNQRLALKLKNEIVGVFGKVAKEFTKEMRIKAPLYIAIFDFSSILNVKKDKVIFREFSQFPSIRRDIAFESDKNFENARFEKFIRTQRVNYLEKFELFDLFTDNKMGNDKKSLAYSFYYRSMDKTLTDEEVNKIHDALRAKIAKELPVQLR